MKPYLFPEGSNNPIESGSNISEIGNTSSNEESSLTTVGIRSGTLKNINRIDYSTLKYTNCTCDT